MESNKRGRKPLPPNLKRNELILLKLTRAEARELRAAASKAQLAVSRYVREMALVKARADRM